MSEINPKIEKLKTVETVCPKTSTFLRKIALF